MRGPLLLVAAACFAISSCGSGGSTECLERNDAKVCADNSDNSIQFSGSGLQPDSAVLIENPDIGLSVYEVDDDGTFEPGPGNLGVLAMIEGTPFTFTITATDADGALIEGTIDISL